MKDVLENFGKIQAPVPEPQSIFIKKRLGTGVFFFVDFAKFSRVRFFIKHPCWLLFNVSLEKCYKRKSTFKY